MQVSCDVSFRATATGEGSADWSNVTWYWYAGPDRREPFDTGQSTLAEVRASWGQTSIAAGESLESNWTFWAPVPFSLRVDHHYRPEGATRTRTTSTTFDCGIPAGTPGAPPTITGVVIAPAGDQVDAGGTLTVTYNAHSDLGLLRTSVELHGACELRQVFTDANLRTDISRTASFFIPEACPIGGVLGISIVAVDAATVYTQWLAPAGKVIVDRTPPVLTPIFFSPKDGTGPSLQGDYFVGDSIQLMPNSWDNYMLSSLNWEILPSGHKDSIVVTSRIAPNFLFIPLPSVAVGDLQLRLYARDHQGLTSPVVTPPGSARVHPTVERPTLSTLVQGEIRDFVIDERRGLIHLLQSNERRLTTLSAATLGVVSTRTIPYATGFDITPSGDTAVLVMQAERTLGILDLSAPQSAISVVPIPELDPTVGQAPGSVRVAANGKAFVVTGGQTSAARELIEVDLRTGAQRVRTEVGNGATGLVRSLDHTVLVALGSSAWRYESATNAFGPAAPAARPGAVSLDASGNRMATSLQIYDGSLGWQRSVYSIFYPNSLPLSVLSADGEHLMQVHAQAGIVRSRTSDGALLDRTRYAGASGISAIRAAPSGAFLVAVESNLAATSRITVMDLR